MPNTVKVAGSLVWLQPGALEHQETSWEIQTRARPHQFLDWCSSFQPHHLQLEGPLYSVIPTLVLLLQISQGPHGLGIKAHTSQSAFKTLPNLTTAHCLSTCLLTPHVERKKQGFLPRPHQFLC